ncbi:MAG: PAAR-like protein [Peptostreptococcaceae bacterium]
MNKLLNKNTKFKCNCSLSPSIFVFNLMPKNVKVSGSNMVTIFDTLRLSTPTLCRNIILPSGGNGSCTYRPNPSWLNTSKKVKCGGINVLTEKSSTLCPLGGKLSPINATIQMKVRGE